ncbi:hypothetical protein EVAR_83098_1 [Eumeta japonica]|uniref:Uncharacterized protein n=1 Tax=Eumeta variegata TaxID=151549 RepID=A0A4C1WQ57_EUMVA|nr:hypothetical protein EVAR_83098_1 [Eumeta japonica]
MGSRPRDRSSDCDFVTLAIRALCVKILVEITDVLSRKKLIPFKKSGNALVTPLHLRLAMGGWLDITQPLVVRMLDYL